MTPQGQTLKANQNLNRIGCIILGRSKSEQMFSGFSTLPFATFAFLVFFKFFYLIFFQGLLHAVSHWTRVSVTIRGMFSFCFCCLISNWVRRWDGDYFKLLFQKQEKENVNCLNCVDCTFIPLVSVEPDMPNYISKFVSKDFFFKKTNI